jgi:hypothetical protein
MHKTLFAGGLAVALALSPAFAATTSHKKAKHTATTKKKAVAKKSMEDEAWDSPAKKAPAKNAAPKKPGAKSKDAALKPTVKINQESKPAPVAVNPKPGASAATKPGDPALDNKSAEDLEKLARTQSQKDPKSALQTYEKLVQNNPNYAYSGDVYANMYQLAVKSHADLLTQLKYAGFAGQKLESGMSRRPVSPQEVQKYKRLEDDITNRWIENEIRNIMAGKQ